jgi:hypothetical protein
LITSTIAIDYDSSPIIGYVIAHSFCWTSVQRFIFIKTFSMITYFFENGLPLLIHYFNQ